MGSENGGQCHGHASEMKKCGENVFQKEHLVGLSKFGTTRKENQRNLTL